MVCVPLRHTTSEYPLGDVLWTPFPPSAAEKPPFFTVPRGACPQTALTRS